MASFKASLEEQKLILEDIERYEPINESYLFDIEYFSAFLATCMRIDGFNETDIPNPGHIGRLLLDVLENNPGSTAVNIKLSDLVNREAIIGWTQQDSYIYPTPERHLLHFTGLILVLGQWFYLIGHNLLEIQKPKEHDDNYYAWAKRDWICTYSLLDSFHRKFWRFVKEVDRSSIDDKGYSIFESLHFSKQGNKDFEKVTEELKRRKEVYDEGKTLVQNAMDKKSFLEAITIAESIISHILFNYLKAKLKKDKSSTLHLLLKEARECLTKDDYLAIELFDELESWRKKRNRAVHGFVESGVDGFEGSIKDFFSSAEDAAVQGNNLLEKLVKWYLDESVHFFTTDFQLDQSSLN